MKYVLEPDNRNCSDDVLLRDLAAVAARLGKPSITKDDYNQHGRFAAATMQKRFGSWNESLRRAGLTVAKRVAIPQEELVADLRRVSALLGSRVLSTTEYSAHGHFSVVTVQRAFGSWPAGVRAAGLEISPLSRTPASLEDLLSNMAAVWEAVGRQPKQSDFVAPLSKYSHDVYVRRFGSWRAALENFVGATNASDQEMPAPQFPTQVQSRSRAQPSTPRDPSWRLRFLVHRRDRFACVACGRSPATHPGVVLHVDHIVPWSKGGLTVFENLQTLCETCNIGKSDLPMHAHAG